MEDRKRWLGPLHLVGVVMWFVGFALLGVNIWWMRTESSALVLWVAAPLLIVVGDLLGSVFQSEMDEDLVAVPFKTGSLIATAFGIGLFLWLTMVMPTASDTGKAALRFFDAIERDDYDAAYEMLSDDAQGRIPREQFEQHLPENYRRQQGATINGVGGGVGVIEGGSSCVEGWLTVPDGLSPHFELGLSKDDSGAMRISALSLDYRCFGD